MVTRIGVNTGAPASAAAFAPTLPTHAAGDRMILAVMGKPNTTTAPTLNQGWTFLGTVTGGTGTQGNDTGQVFIHLYAKTATSGAETAPTVTPGAVAPNSWVWVCAVFRPGAGKEWRDAIGSSIVSGGGDSNTLTPLTAAPFVALPMAEAGDAFFACAANPSDAATAMNGATLTATGLTGGTVDTTSTNYVENSLGQDCCGVWTTWTGFTGTQTAQASASFTLTGATNFSGAVGYVLLREQVSTGPALPDVVVGGTLKPVASASVIIGGVKKPVTSISVIQNGVKKAVV
jgi:hypothetical protein